MRKHILFLLALAGILFACKPESEHYTIPRLEDTMHLRASASSIRLSHALSADTAITFSWDIPALTDGITGYEYYFKMDIADNEFATSITPMLVDGGNTVSFTHGALNDQLERWGITAGTSCALEAEIIAHPKGLSTYVKPMLSTVTFEAVGYASVLYLAGSATTAGTTYTEALEMSKIAGRNAYRYVGTLAEGDLLFLTERSDSAEVYGQGDTEGSLCYTTLAAATPVPVSHAGFYIVEADIDALTVTATEPLYLFGSAANGWDLGSAIAMEQLSEHTLSWSGLLSEGELKFLCEPTVNSRRFDGAFWLAPADGTAAEGTTAMVFAPNGTPDSKWSVPSTGLYTIRVDLSIPEVTFSRDEDFDKLPYKQIWLCGDATPGGWNTPFSEQFTYDTEARNGSFVWTGNLAAGEIKFPLNPSSYEGAFFIAPEAGTPISAEPTPVVYTANDQPDQKWQVSASGKYKITINVLDLTVQFQQQ